MRYKILFLLAFTIGSAKITFGQDVILNNFEGDNSKIVSRNGAKFSVVENSSINQNTMLNNFEPGSPNVVSRFGTNFTIVANPKKSDVNATENCIKVGRTSSNWYELIAFPVTTYTVPANTTQYLSISVNYPSQPDIAIRIDGEDENASGNPNVAIRALNKYTDIGNWQTLRFPLEGGVNGAEIKAILIFTDVGNLNEPKGFTLNNTDKFGYLDEIKVINDIPKVERDNTFEDYLTDVKAELVKNWPTNRTINLVFHGHSVPSGYTTTPTVKTLDAYPNKILEKLSAKYPTAVINTIKTAIGGEHSIKGAARFDDDVLVHKPDVLFIDYSLNDRSQGLAATYAAWDEMIKKAKAKNIPVILFTATPYQNVNLSDTSTDLYKHQQQVIRLANEHRVGLVDSYERIREKVLAGESVNSFLASYNHPNAKGHNLVADEIMKFF
jgi:lysophospholipase L1-like esterase